MYEMTKSTFKIVQDVNSGKRFVTKVEDELIKNHQETSSELISAIVPEQPNNQLCPVRYFEKYTDKLDPKFPYLWQKPRFSPVSNTIKVRYSDRQRL